MINVAAVFSLAAKFIERLYLSKFISREAVAGAFFP